jgi:isopentenyl-diphosphate delta-isomerase type 1
MSEQQEIYAVVDAEDKVIGKATRREIHEKGLWHRSVHVFVLNGTGALFLQKRSFSKDLYPGCWDSSSSGHVDWGESYEQAASRELWEELGIRETLVFQFQVKACKETGWEHVGFFTTTTTKKITINADEIIEGRYYTPREVREWFIAKPAEFAPGFILLFEKAFKRGIL